MKDITKKLACCVFLALGGAACSSSSPEMYQSEVYQSDEFERDVVYKQTPAQQQQTESYKSTKTYSDEDWFYDYYDFDEEAERNLDSNYDYYNGEFEKRKGQ